MQVAISLEHTFIQKIKVGQIRIMQLLKYMNSVFFCKSNSLLQKLRIR